MNPIIVDEEIVTEDETESLASHHDIGSQQEQPLPRDRHPTGPGQHDNLSAPLIAEQEPPVRRVSRADNDLQVERTTALIAGRDDAS